MPNELEQLKNRLETLERLVANLQRPNSVTPEFKQVLDRSVVSASGKAASAENKTVDESGSAPPYSVLGPPDRFIVIGSYHLAAWDN